MYRMNVIKINKKNTTENNNSLEMDKQSNII